MSKLFYDHLLSLDKVEKEIKKHATSADERAEMWHIVDGMVHHKIMEALLDRLPRAHHEEFLHIFTQKPHDVGILDYFWQKTGLLVSEIVKHEIDILTEELLHIFKGDKKHHG